LGIVHPARASLRELHERLQAGLMEMAGDGLRPVLIVDEAQALPDRTLEAIRLLTNLETERRKLLQVVLFGQPELDARLQHPQFRQLRQRITFSCRLAPLSRSDVVRYIQFRSARAGAKERLFTPWAMRRIARASGGVPRLVNVLCHKALLAAWGRGRGRAGIGDVGRAIADTESLERPWPGRIARLAALALVVGCSWVLLSGLSGGSP
jgi:MSHA biogenesis protein MshM